ncbi:hypothetical protein GGS23DRAFT_66279 [Durotheca rogersii]|uniref:uncharacterized protein n=1 Tax=Durotheca rogersii TaxID=419775 RepID=UPI00221E386E|nr:uncharacterized protein GGS23DRAFT_66279 [Durotheca rogersii]KAI5862775.1 hypothetical protein GGS23DRAFT_66279 [Durotheca rogersii]
MMAFALPVILGGCVTTRGRAPGLPSHTMYVRAVVQSNIHITYLPAYIRTYSDICPRKAIKNVCRVRTYVRPHVLSLP